MKKRSATKIAVSVPLNITFPTGQSNLVNVAEEECASSKHMSEGEESAEPDLDPHNEDLDDLTSNKLDFVNITVASSD